MKICTYAIIDSDKKLDESIKGVEGRLVFNIPYRDIGAASSEIGEEIKEITKKHILEHEKVVERLMKKFTVLPVRFSTVFKKKEDVLSMMKEHYSDFREDLSRLCNKVEFGIKVIWSAETIRKRIINASRKSNHRVALSGDSPAKTFLKERFEEYKIEKAFEEEADKYIAFIDSFFNGIVVEKKLKRLQTENLLLNAFYLIEKEKEDDLREAFERARGARSDFKYLFTGPWPPYNFVTLTKGSIQHKFGLPEGRNDERES